MGRKATGQTPTQHVRIPEDRWKTLAEKAGAGQRAAVINELVAWYIREPGAKLPTRPQ